MCSPAIFETCFSFDKDICIAATEYYNVLLYNCAFPLTSIVQLINFTCHDFKFTD